MAPQHSKHAGKQVPELSRTHLWVDWLIAGEEVRQSLPGSTLREDVPAEAGHGAAGKCVEILVWDSRGILLPCGVCQVRSRHRLSAGTFLRATLNILNAFRNNNNSNNNNNNIYIYTGDDLASSGFRNGPVKKYHKDLKAIQGNTT